MNKGWWRWPNADFSKNYVLWKETPAYREISLLFTVMKTQLLKTHHVHVAAIANATPETITVFINVWLSSNPVIYQMGYKCFFFPPPLPHLGRHLFGDERKWIAEKKGKKNPPLALSSDQSRVVSVFSFMDCGFNHSLLLSMSKQGAWFPLYRMWNTAVFVHRKKKTHLLLSGFFLFVSCYFLCVDVCWTRVGFR